MDGSTAKKDPNWAKADQLMSEQKFDAAKAETNQVLAKARAEKNDALVAEALVRTTELEKALGGFETAVKRLRTEVWPTGAQEKVLVGLYYAASLTTYTQSYGYEIRQREKTVSSDQIDLKAWTQIQIAQEIGKTYQEILPQEAVLANPIPPFFARHISNGNYPLQVRPVMRDVVVEQIAEFLSDSSYWSPSDASDVYRLPLQKLAIGESIPANMKLGDEQIHPLVRLAGLLSSHARFHEQAGRKEAALEARYQLIERLHTAATKQPDKNSMIASLRQLQKASGNAAFGWWSHGQAILAKMLMQQTENPRNLIDALAEADAGLANKNSSALLGLNECSDLRDTITKPVLHLQSMQTDAAGKPSVLVEHQGLRKIYFRAYSLDFEKQLKTMPHSQFWKVSNGSDIEAVLQGDIGQPVSKWTMEVPATPDFKTHRSYAVPAVKDPGFYIIIGSSTEDFSRDRADGLSLARMIISDLVLTTKAKGGGEFELQTLSGKTGQPVPNVPITLLGMQNNGWSKPSIANSAGKTDKEGRLTVGGSLVSKFKGLWSGNSSQIPLARNGAHVAISDDQFNPGDREQKEGLTTDMFVYTDRSVYRPEQKMFYKVVAFRGRRTEGDFKVLAKQKITVTLADSNYQAVHVKELTTNAFGTVAGEFMIPAGRALGGWTVRAEIKGDTGYLPHANAQLLVEEYKRPTFEANFLPNEKELRLNQKVSLKAEARYYFGLPVTAGKVSWRIQRQKQLPWWAYFFGRSSSNSAPEMIATGTSKLNSDGTFPVDFVAEADAREAKNPGVTFQFTVEADVTDEGGETRTATKNFRLGFAALEAKVRIDQGYFAGGEKIEIPVELTNLEGEGRAGQGEWQIQSLQQPKQTPLPADLPHSAANLENAEATTFQTAGDKQRARWETDINWPEITATWKEAKAVSSGTLKHDAKGKAKVALPKGLPAGLYRFSFRSKDAFGAPVIANRDFFVTGKNNEIALPLLVLAEQDTVKVGGTAKLWVHSGFDGQPITVEIFRDGKSIKRMELKAQAGNNVVEIPVKEADRGGFSYHVTTLRDHQLMTEGGNFNVPWDNKVLQLEVATLRDKIRPGAKEKVRVTVKDPSGKALAEKTAELVGYMYDRSLDFFKEHGYPQIPQIYPSKQSLPRFFTNLGTHREYEGPSFYRPTKAVALQASQLNFLDGYGLGGMGMRKGSFYGARGGGGRGRSYEEESDGMAMESFAAAPMADMPEGSEQSDKSAPSQRAKSMAEPKKSMAASLKKDEPPKGSADAGDAPLRSNFSETAFWTPQLLLGDDSTATFEFTVPDSLTAWNFYVHATDKDMRSGMAKGETRSVKDLMVRPYVPRFFREGDDAVVKVQVDNSSDVELKGDVFFEIQDPETGKSAAADFGMKDAALKKAFTVKKGSSTSLAFNLKAPRKVGSYAFKIKASSKGLSDGELRLVPVLPSRMHLAQSRFVTLRNKDEKKMEFPDMKKPDPTLIHDRMVVTIDGQLFYGVLQSLPYLVTYPYECSEQTLNRFLSTGIVSSVFAKYPAVATMAKEFSKRETRLQAFDLKDANQRMTMEESPWLQESQGGSKDKDVMINVLDARIAKAERNRSLAKLKKLQQPDGGFPWFEGGRSSEYITLYILMGFARANEFGVEVPKDVIQNAWRYIKTWTQGDLKRCMKDEGCVELVSLMSYVLSSYPDTTWTGGVFDAAEQKRFLDYAFTHWKNNSPLVKGFLALSLSRNKRKADAKLVWDSVMDSAKSDPEQGTFWAREDRSWLWYNDTIESHAFGLRVQMELAPEDKKNDGLVQWLFLNKKLNHWKSTRATAESIYSLVHFLEKTAALGVREQINVETAGIKKEFVFEPSKYTGAKNQIVIPGDKMNPATASLVTVKKTTPGFAFASATWHFSTEKVPAEGSGDFFSVDRKYFLRENNGKEWTLKPLLEGMKVKVGDQVEVQLSLRTKHEAEYVHLRDPRGAGFEPESQVSGYKYDLGIATYEEIRDSGANYFFNWLPVGEYNFKYRVRANMSGTFRVGPATVQSLYAPEFNAYSSGRTLSVE